MSFSRIDGALRNTQGEALSGVSVYVCTEPNTIPSTNPPIPPSPLATIYQDVAGTQPITQPIQTDGNGNFFFYAAPNTYTIIYFDTENRIGTTVFPNQTVATPGGGSVSSVALSMPVEFSVTGSPVTGTGTLTVNKANVNANAVLAGPASGSPAPWSARALVKADLPSGTGSVTSVAETVSTDANLSASVTGSPITTAGTLALTLALANQLANSFLAGPVSGGAGAVSGRAIVPPDFGGFYNSLSVAVTTASWSGGTITITLASIPAGFTPGLFFFVSGINPGGYNGIRQIGSVAGNIVTIGGAFANPGAYVSGGRAFFTPVSPTLDASTATTFRLFLDQSVTSSAVVNPTPGERITFIIVQDSIGLWTFAWPSNFRGASAIAPEANMVSVQSFVYDGDSAVWRADGPGLTEAQ